MNPGEKPEIPIPRSIERLVLSLLCPEDDIQSFFNEMTVLPEFEEGANECSTCIWTREESPVIMSKKNSIISFNNTLEKFFTKVAKKQGTTGKEMNEGSLSESSEEINSHIQKKSIVSDFHSMKDNVENPEEAYSQDMFSEGVPSPEEVSTARKVASNVKKSEQNLSDEEIIPGTQCFSQTPKLSLSLSLKNKSPNMTNEASGDSSIGDSVYQSVISPKKKPSTKKKGELSSSDDSGSQTVINTLKKPSSKESVSEIYSQDEESAVNTNKSFDQKGESSKCPIRRDKTIHQVSRKSESLLELSNKLFSRKCTNNREKSPPSNKSDSGKEVDYNNENWLELIKEQMKDVALVSADRKFYLEEITEDDELYVLKCPQFVKLESLKGAEIAVEGESTLHLEREGKSILYNSYFTGNSGKVNVNLIGSEEDTDDVKLGVFPLKGCINLIENEESLQTDQNEEKGWTAPESPVHRIKLPQGIRFRHSSAGNLVDSFYEGDSGSNNFIQKKKSKKMKESSEKNVSMEVSLTETELPKKTKKRKLNDLDPPVESVIRAESVTAPDDIEQEDLTVSKKKKKKTRHEDPPMESVIRLESVTTADDIQQEDLIISKKKKKKKRHHEDPPVESVIRAESVTAPDDIEQEDLTVSKKKKKKKRHHEDPPIESVIRLESVTTADDIQQDDLIISKKKKKKKRHHEDPPVESVIRAESVTAPDDIEQEDVTVSKKKKKKKRHHEGAFVNTEESFLKIKEEIVEQSAIEDGDFENAEESFLKIKEEIVEQSAGDFENAEDSVLKIKEEIVEQSAECTDGVRKKKKKKKRSHTSD